MAASQARARSSASEGVKNAILTARDLAMLATAASYDVNDEEDRARSVTELSHLFFRIARTLEVDLFIEAGAKDATSSRDARRLLDPRRIVAFEANPYTYERHHEKHDNLGQGVEYLHLALSDSPGKVTFNVLHDTHGAPRADGRSSLLVRDGADAANSAPVTVEATTLDTFFGDHSYERCAVWVDVEGAMEPVLRGGRETFGRAAVVIAEVEDRTYWADQWLRRDVVSYFYDLGLLPIARDYQSRYQYNIVFVRQELLDHDRVRWLLARYISAAPNARISTRARTVSKQVAASAVAAAAAPAGGQVTVIARRVGRSVRRRLVTWRGRRSRDDR